jgi:hypothetical protein
LQWFADRVQLDLRLDGAGTFVFEDQATTGEVSAPLVVEAVEPTCSASPRDHPRRRRALVGDRRPVST